MKYFFNMRFVVIMLQLDLLFDFASINHQFASIIICSAEINAEWRGNPISACRDVATGVWGCDTSVPNGHTEHGKVRTMDKSRIVGIQRKSSISIFYFLKYLFLFSSK